MRVFLNDGLRRLQILSSDHIRRFHDLGSARSFLHRLLGEPGNRLAVRDALAGERASTSGLGDDELVEELARRLVHDDLRLVSCASPFLGLGLEATTAAAAPPPSPAAATTPLEDEQAAKEAKGEPAPEKEEEHWIEIELLDDEGNPVPGEQYFVELPDGSTISGRLDDQGRARVEGIDPGTAKITFPNLDKETYDPK